MNKEKTVREKIKQSAIAAAGISGIAALFLVITAISAAVSAFTTDIPTSAADFAGVITESIMLAAAALICSIMFYRIAKSGTPFSKWNVKSLRITALLVMLEAVASPVVTAIVLGILLDDFFVAPVNSDMTSSLLTGGLIMILAQIFNYGCKLQQEADETL